jgi:hypothetical protein
VNVVLVQTFRRIRVAQPDFTIAPTSSGCSSETLLDFPSGSTCGDARFGRRREDHSTLHTPMRDPDRKLLKPKSSRPVTEFGGFGPSEVATASHHQCLAGGRRTPQTA